MVRHLERFRKGTKKSLDDCQLIVISVSKRIAL